MEEFAEKLKQDLGELEKDEEAPKETVPFKGLMNAKLEVLSILNGIEFAGFSEEAKRKAIEKLNSRIAELSRERLTLENLQRLGLYAFALEIIKTRNFERLKEVERL
ncbi:hypothetical protein [Thermococcus sp. GR6]|uniref:hypothetical protein n=1 Tax=Thermococcus sp. GR6 TaxID=1638256 RepID=UPI00142F506F|nr:hypothetical protein [Thermococcus sp. GR6]NJE42361.1 hypothetical protein [Thermococcus sp. GR6]